MAFPLDPGDLTDYQPKMAWAAPSSLPPFQPHLHHFQCGAEDPLDLQALVEAVAAVPEEVGA